jgi:molybdate transport system regulatory protein
VQVLEITILPLSLESKMNRIQTLNKQGFLRLYLRGHNAMETSIKYRFWINNENGLMLGEGRVQLLENIIKEGSISKAAKSLEMSYKKAWRLINEINESTSEPMVIRITGGLGGGGTQVTPKGIEAIKTYRNIQEKANNYFQTESKSLEF